MMNKWTSLMFLCSYLLCFLPCYDSQKLATTVFIINPPVVFLPPLFSLSLPQPNRMRASRTPPKTRIIQHGNSHQAKHTSTLIPVRHQAVVGGRGREGPVHRQDSGKVLRVPPGRATSKGRQGDARINYRGNSRNVGAAKTATMTTTATTTKVNHQQRTNAKKN